MPTADRLTLRLYQPLPNPLPYPFNREAYLMDSLDLGPDIADVVMTKQLPGGDGTLTVSFKPEHDPAKRWARLPQPVQVHDLGFGHCELWAGAARVWAGRGVELDLAAGHAAGGVRTYTAHGYGVAALKDTVLLNLPGLALTGDAALAFALLACGVGLTPASQTAGLYQRAPTYWSLPGFEGEQPAQVLDQVLKVGARGNALFDFWVDHERRCYLQARIAPTQPDYLIPFDDTVQWHNSFDDCYGTVVVRYTDADPTTSVVALTESTFTSVVSGGTTTNTTVTHTSSTEHTSNVARVYTLTDPTFSARFDGVVRTQQVQGGKMDPLNAQFFAATWLGQHAYVIPRVSLTRSNGRGLELWGGGADYPPYLVEPGQWVQVADQPAQIIIGVHYDFSKREANFELNQPLHGETTLLHETARVAQHVVRATSPVTGAKLASTV